MDQILFQSKWLTVKESSRGFQYLERKGKDSVAVFLLRKKQDDPQHYEVLVRHQHLCLNNEEANGSFNLFSCPITGALDEGESPEDAAIRETFEESGYRADLQPLGQYIVGTQLNEICFLYYADVTDIKPDQAQQDGTYLESIAQNQWHSFEYLQDCEYSACQIGFFKLRSLLFDKIN